MSSVCADQHKLHPSHQLHSFSKKLLKSIDIPPRKLLGGRLPTQEADMYYARAAAEETLLQKFLPYNTGVDDDDPNDVADPYSSDHFRMYEFKVRHCTRSRSHDWTDCPFAHPGEKARRRDPRTFHYSGQVCPEYRRGVCSRGNSCEFAHGVFECWLHPARYRTEACKDGKNCKRKVCFFAHTPRQLRVLPPNSQNSLELASKKKFLSSSSNHHCCMFCHCSTTSSPTSTLLGISHFSPPLSPPLSPSQRSINAFSPMPVNHGVLSYKDVLTELMSSLEVMNFSEAASSPLSAKSPNLPWLDVSFNNEDQKQQQFILSPSTPNPSGSANFSSGDRSSKSFTAESSDPDLGWVNELLM
ncbi:hypothetical protein FH972_014647 [Carpinus fangiana]|uniref:C3H1-type domain-containing protein n=1 Tax=Carpinus fangiana TaxID=176857 RepID=A0A5N6RB05_9ROSI|nr:hypothetical protein FH972_014647 [Carpinus fangiana]